MSNAVHRLRDYCKTFSTRPFNARGSSVVRCERCQMAEFACLCPWQVQLQSRIDFILIMHRKEVYKTTNTGRLIADMFPENTRAFLWDRTEPDPSLIQALDNPERHTVILFPEDNQSNTIVTAFSHDEKPLTVVLLDGTWKQASRMIRLSEWLQHLPRIAIESSSPQTSYIRQAIHQNQLSTAQAAACLLEQYGDTQAATSLHHYFALFNEHCIATRRNIAPTPGESHHYLHHLINQQHS